MGFASAVPECSFQCGPNAGSKIQFLNTVPNAVPSAVRGFQCDFQLRFPSLSFLAKVNRVKAFHPPESVEFKV